MSLPDFFVMGVPKGGTTALHARMAWDVPNAKIVAVIRDPVDRAYSNWNHLRCRPLRAGVTSERGGPGIWMRLL
jgi:hypothetical protein